MRISKKIPTAGAPTPSVGKNCGKWPESAVWNLRLALGQEMQGDKIREIEWAPAKTAPAFLVPEESPSQEYGPGPQATAFGRAAGRFGADSFVLQEDGTLRCPAGTHLWLSEVRQENAFTEACRLRCLPDGLSAL